MKVAGGRIHAAYSYSRRRWKWANTYVVMVVVCSVFGCGIEALMGLHSLKETRSSLLIKDKDDKILSLHLLLQKEREHVRQVKMKIEEIKTEMVRLGSEKAELGSRISDMKSKISSLTEEQRAVELAYQNEAKLWRDKDQNHQIQIQDLKHRLQLLAANGSLILPSNLTAQGKGKTSRETNEDGRSEPKYNDELERERTEEQLQKSGVRDDTDTGEVARTRQESQSSENQELEVNGMEMQETSHGQHHNLRWRSDAKQTQGKRSSPSNEASINNGGSRSTNQDGAYWTS